MKRRRFRKNFVLPSPNIHPDVDPNRPFIYRWSINDQHGQLVAQYIGKADKSGSRRMRDYESNVNGTLFHLAQYNDTLENLVKTAKPVPPAPIIISLTVAHLREYEIKLEYLVNADSQDIDRVEREYISRYSEKSVNVIGNANNDEAIRIAYNRIGHLRWSNLETEMPDL